MAENYWIAEYSINPRDGYRIGPEMGKAGPFKRLSDAKEQAEALLDEMVRSPYLNDMYHEVRIYKGSELYKILKGPVPRNAPRGWSPEKRTGRKYRINGGI